MLAVHTTGSSVPTAPPTRTLENPSSAILGGCPCSRGHYGLNGPSGLLGRPSKDFPLCIPMYEAHDPAAQRLQGLPG